MESRSVRMNESVDAEGERGADRARARWCCGGTDCHTELSAGSIPERAAASPLPDRSPAGEPQRRRKKRKKRLQRNNQTTFPSPPRDRIYCPHQHLTLSSQRCQVGGGTSLFAYNGCTRKVGKQKWLVRAWWIRARARGWFEPRTDFDWEDSESLLCFGVIWALCLLTCSAGFEAASVIRCVCACASVLIRLRWFEMRAGQRACASVWGKELRVGPAAEQRRRRKAWWSARGCTCACDDARLWKCAKEKASHVWHLTETELCWQRLFCSSLFKWSSLQSNCSRLSEVSLHLRVLEHKSGKLNYKLKSFYILNLNT